MAQEKEDRPGAVARKTGEAADESMRRATGMQGKSAASAARETGNRGDGGAGDDGLTASPPATRRERYIIGTRTSAGGQPIPQHSMEEVVQYLNRLENVEVVKRIKLGGTQPFTANGRSTNEVVVAKIDAVKAQRLRALAPAHLIIERDALLACADYQAVPTRVAQIGTLLPLRSVATDISIRVIGERDQPLAGATVVIDAGELPAQALTDETGTARITCFGSSTEAIRGLFIRSASTQPGCADIKIGLIDSGCDNSHPLLRQVVQGKDFANGSIDTSWTQDLVSHGTHGERRVLGAPGPEAPGGAAKRYRVHRGSGQLRWPARIPSSPAGCPGGRCGRQAEGISHRQLPRSECHSAADWQ
jgi:subtilisin family serine protease